MKRLFLTSVAALFLATGTAHADTTLPDTEALTGLRSRSCMIDGERCQPLRRIGLTELER
jgi:hypothetical protein